MMKNTFETQEKVEVELKRKIQPANKANEAKEMQQYCQMRSQSAQKSSLEQVQGELSTQVSQGELWQPKEAQPRPRGLRTLNISRSDLNKGHLHHTMSLRHPKKTVLVHQLVELIT